MSIKESIRYGAAELKGIYNRNLGLALGISVGFHLVLIFLYIFGINLGKASEKTSAAPIAKMKLTNLASPPPPEENVPPPPPPPMVPPQLQMSGAGTGGVAARAGNPVPVPDALIAPDVKEFATTAEISVATAEGGDGTGFGGLGEGEGLGAPVNIDKPVEVKTKEDLPEPDEFIPVEEEPGYDPADLMKRVIYPEMAKRNNIEGTVIVRVLVDKNGRAVKNMIDRSDNKLLEDAAIKAVMSTRFSPAIQNKTPVAVWVQIPVVFSLK
jgi:protein TonB